MNPGRNSEDVDVLIVGSGGAGMMAALRAADLGLRPVIIERASLYGGTTATSGGIFWTPCHGRDGLADTPERALDYLRHVTGGEARDERLRAFVENAPRMANFLERIGVRIASLVGSHDYFSEVPNALAGRSLRVAPFSGDEIGDDYLRMRAPNALALLFNRYAMDARESAALVQRSPGWEWTAFKLMARYWLDLPMRVKSRRDRRATRGDALIGHLRRDLIKRDVPLVLNCALKGLIVEHGRVVGAHVEQDGAPRTIRARRGVVLAAGGYEWNQARRDAHVSVQTQAGSSITPAGANSGDALAAGEAIGAATEFLDYLWWQPVIRLGDAVHGLALDQRHPHSIIVNRHGARFANESQSYDRFGMAMVRDQQRGGAPRWIVFDATFRENYALAALYPSIVVPDWRVPRAWWDTAIFRAPSIAALAQRIDAPQLEASIARFNGFCATGIDADFARGAAPYDRAWGDRRVTPNPCLGGLATAPFYAVRVDLGDIGAKGGLKCDAYARVLDTHGAPIPGLYAAGNSAGSPFANAYPGAGGTIGAALTFGFVAAEHIAGSA